MLSRNKIKYLSSLKIKKYRNLHGQMMIEGEKIVRDSFVNHRVKFHQLIATEQWLRLNSAFIPRTIEEVLEAQESDLSRISSFETAPPVMAVVDIPTFVPDMKVLASTFSIALDGLQDPGNLGTIIRTANWFGIGNVLCSEDCAELSNPKVIQASMGAVFNLRVHYVQLTDIFKKMEGLPDFSILGTFMTGTPVGRLNPVQKGIVVFGNESRGISDELLPLISQKITIPAANASEIHVESLNVASSVAVTLSILHPGI